MRYHWQLGWYQHACKVVTGKQLPVHVITVEQSEPYDVVVYNVPQAILTKGYDEAYKVAVVYTDSVGYGSALIGVATTMMEFQLPEWAYVSDEPLALQIEGEEVVF